MTDTTAFEIRREGCCTGSTISFFTPAEYALGGGRNPHNRTAPSLSN